MSFDNLENERWRDECDRILEECLGGSETVVNSATGSAQHLFGTDFLSPSDFNTTFDWAEQIGLAGTDEQGQSFLSLEPALPVSESTGSPLVSNPADWPVTPQHWWSADNMGSTGSAGMEYPGIYSSETPSSLSALSSPVDGSLLNPTSLGTQSSYMPFSPMTIATGYEGGLLPNNMTLSESASPRPLALATMSRRRRIGSREIMSRERKRVGETKRDQRKRDKPEKCPECGKGSPYNRDRDRHMKTHQKNRKRVRCPYCEKCLMADQPHNLKRHLKRQHPDQDVDAAVFR